MITNVYYTLNVNHIPMPIGDVLRWAQWMEEGDNKVVALSQGTLSIDGDRWCDIKVSTVFIGIDMSISGDGDLLFETMVFGGPLDQYMKRYCTWSEAARSHDNIVVALKMIETFEDISRLKRKWSYI